MARSHQVYMHHKHALDFDLSALNMHFKNGKAEN